MAQAFIIMQIGNAELDALAASAIVPAIVACGLEAKRVDKHNRGGLLKGEIIDFIQSSDIIIADLTNERPNCYLEVGYAMGIDKFKNLILTVREDHFPDHPSHVRGGPKVHFDLAGYDILRWSPNDVDAFRIELEKRVRRRLAIVGQTPNAPNPGVRESWFDNQRAIADEAMLKTSRCAYMELMFQLSLRTENFPLPLLRTAAEVAPIHTFGWPIAPSLQRGEFKPLPRADGIAALIVLSSRESFDYWAIRRNGDFYWRGSLFEDDRREGEVFFDTRVVRVTEAFLYCARLYTAMGLDRARVVTILIRHVGLRGRHLTSSSPERYISPRSPAMENASEASITTRLELIEANLVENVKAVLAPLFSLFDFFELGDGVYEDIISKFVAGQRW